MDKKTPDYQKLLEKKLNAFVSGTKVGTSRRELEEKRKKKEDEEAAHVFETFVETFQQPEKASKSWIKAGTYNSGHFKEDQNVNIYNPKPRIASAKNNNLSSVTKEIVKLVPNLLNTKTPEVSQRDLFLNELKQMQEERKERIEIKKKILSGLNVVEPTEGKTDDFDSKYICTTDTTTTNLYIGNLSPDLNENDLMQIFGKYGPLASIKIMWPRSDDQKIRGKNCGFVGYMCRKDAERTKRLMSGKTIKGFTILIDWSKPLPYIPSQPIYVPPTLQKLLKEPPVFTGLPFNAQFSDKSAINEIDLNNINLYEILPKTVIKVVQPNLAMLQLIHRMIEFVLREGPIFEALIMTKEINNPQFSFLFDNKSPNHIYYRWKMFSLLQGDQKNEWRMEPFRMFEGGSMWIPLQKNVYTKGMPDYLFTDEENESIYELSITQRERLEHYLRHISLDRTSIAEVMVFCVDHAQAVEEITECIQQSLCSKSTNIKKKIARLYAISDIIYNVKDKKDIKEVYVQQFKLKLNKIFKHFFKTCAGIDNEKDKKLFKFRVLRVLKTWEHWKIYPEDFLNGLKKYFVDEEVVVKTESLNEKLEDELVQKNEPVNIDLDGIPLGCDDNFEKETKVKGEESNEIDGLPMTDDETASTPRGSPLQQDNFIPSRWETVDPEEIEAQAMTTSKWEEIIESKWEKDMSFDNDEEEEYKDMYKRDDDKKHENKIRYDNTKDNETNRKILREIETKIIQYQDELESGERKLKDGWTISERVEHYRRHLRKKYEIDDTDDKKISPNNSSSDKKYGDDRKEDKSKKNYKRRSRSSSSEEKYKKNKSDKSRDDKDKYKRKTRRSRSSSDDDRSYKKRSGKRQSKSLSPSDKYKRKSMKSSRSDKHYSSDDEYGKYDKSRKSEKKRSKSPSPDRSKRGHKRSQSPADDDYKRKKSKSSRSSHKHHKNRYDSNLDYSPISENSS